MPQDSIDEEFHEHMIYRGMYLKRTGSSTSEPETVDTDVRTRKLDGASPDDECVVPSLCLVSDRRLSPFASSDSLANDLK